MNKEKINRIFEIFELDDPSPKTELNYINDYTLLVAIVLSAQATDVGVNKATKKLFEIIDSPHKMVDLGEDNLKKYIKTIGLYNSKAKNVIQLSKNLIDWHGGNVPDNFDDLIKLPGVGRKTANVFLNCYYGTDSIGVDTHVFRVANRTGITKAKNAEQSEKQLLKKIPKKFRRYAHHWFIIHGRYICKARKPDCKSCKIVDFCDYKEKTF